VFYNSLGTEAAGVQLYFLSPTPLRTIMLAKNILHAGMFAIVATMAATLSSLRLGAPDKQMMAATAAWILFSLPCNLAAGNVFSVRMPYRVNPGRISRQRGSQANSLLSLLVQLGILAVSAVVFALAWYLHRIELAIPIFLVMSAAATFAWWRILASVEMIAYDRRDALIAALTREA
jgi:ABC-2 type transport system permease protein